MALQLLPILLLGGGAAYVYKKQKERKHKRSGSNCPPETVVTIGEMASVGAQVSEKFKNSKEPYGEANHALKQLLPKGCNKNSKDARVKIQFTDDGKASDFDISVTDFYMLTLSNSVGVRVDRGAITQEQAREYQTKALEWYKKTTGKTFDPASLDLEKFAKVLGEAMLEAMKEAVKGGKLKPSKPERCPAEVVVDVEGRRQEMVQVIGEAFAMGGRNPFVIADQVFARIVPDPCTKRDFTTIAEVRLGHETKKLDLAAVYAAFVLDIVEELVRRNLISQTELMNIFGQLQDNYKRLTGQKLPLNLI